MRVGSVYKDRIGLWVWEVLDKDGLYLRSQRSFTHKCEAFNDLENATHLIRSDLTFN